MRLLVVALVFLLFDVASLAQQHSVFLHRGKSSFEPKEPIHLLINDSSKIMINQGELLVFQLPVIDTISVEANFEKKKGRFSFNRPKCTFPQFNLVSLEDSISFLELKGEGCRIRELEKLFAAEKVQSLIDNNQVEVKPIALDTSDSVVEIPDIDFMKLIESIVNPGELETIAKSELDSLRILALEAAELRKKLREQEKKTREQFQEYFDLMKAINQLDQNVTPLVGIHLEEGGMNQLGMMRYNIRATYTYDIEATESLKAELIHYPSGAYQLDKSAAASATAFAMKKSIDTYLLEYFEPGGIVKIRVIGSADKAPISRALAYSGEYGEITEQSFSIVEDYFLKFEEDFNIDSLLVQNDDLPLIDESTGLLQGVTKQQQEEAPLYEDEFSLKAKGAYYKTNEHLALLRAIGIRDYINREVSSLSQTDNNFIFQVKIEDGIGGVFRKVVIELLIEDILRDK